jgi:hypothetical protein
MAGYYDKVKLEEGQNGLQLLVVREISMNYSA